MTEENDRDRVKGRQMSYCGDQREQLKEEEV